MNKNLKKSLLSLGLCLITSTLVASSSTTRQSPLLSLGSLGVQSGPLASGAPAVSSISSGSLSWLPTFSNRPAWLSSLRPTLPTLSAPSRENSYNWVAGGLLVAALLGYGGWRYWRPAAQKPDPKNPANLIATQQTVLTRPTEVSNGGDTSAARSPSILQVITHPQSGWLDGC